MCFSATASFGAGVLLAAAGGVAVKKSGGIRQRFFAVIPLLFAAQQVAEGFVWLSLMNNNYAAHRQLFVHVFLLFAFAVWPVWVPLSIMLIEKNEKRKRLLKWLLATGVFVSLYVAVCLFVYPVQTSAPGHHIQYLFLVPALLQKLVPVRDGFYFIATLPAAFISTRKNMWLFGVVLILSYAVSKMFFNDEALSVWCFLAALLSLIVVYILDSQKSSFSRRSSLFKVLIRR